MADDTTISARLRRPFQEGEPIQIIEPRGNRHVTRLKHGDVFHHPRTGYLRHDDIIGSPPGSLLLSADSLEVICLRLTLEDFILRKLERRTSIIHPKDLAPLLIRGNLFPGARVLEAGMGSGAATITLLRFLGPEGELVSYERREEFIEVAKENIARFAELYGDPATPHTIELRDVYEGIGATDLDLVLLDVAEPHRAVGSAAGAVRPGGTLLCWLPTVTQVYQLARDLQREPGWADIEIRELMEREWQVRENAMRPQHRMVGHTGFLIRARRVATETAYPPGESAQEAPPNSE